LTQARKTFALPSMPALSDVIGKVVCVNASEKMICPPFYACPLR